MRLGRKTRSGANTFKARSASYLFINSFDDLSVWLTTANAVAGREDAAGSSDFLFVENFFMNFCANDLQPTGDL